MKHSAGELQVTVNQMRPELGRLHTAFRCLAKSVQKQDEKDKKRIPQQKDKIFPADVRGIRTHVQSVHRPWR